MEPSELAQSPELRACTYEPFPFDVSLPRIERGRVVLPAAEPGVRPYSAWQPNDGLEVPVYRDGLLLGRLVLVPARPTAGVALSSELRMRALDLAGALSSPGRMDPAPSVRE